MVCRACSPAFNAAQSVSENAGALIRRVGRATWHGSARPVRGLGIHLHAIEPAGRKTRGPRERWTFLLCLAKPWTAAACCR
jgi:hypothetical protein